MFISPVEPARVKRQILDPGTDDTLNPIQSAISKILNPGDDEPSTTTRRPTATRPSTSAPTLSSSRPTRTIDITSSSTRIILSASSTSTSSTSSDSSSSTTTSLPSPDLPIPPLSTSSSDKSTVVVTQTSLSSSPSSTSDTSNNNNPTPVGMSPIVRGVVIAASVSFGLVFLALVTRKIFQFRRRQKQKRVSWTDNISPFAPTVNETGYEKPLPRAAVPAPSPAPAPASIRSYPPPSRMSRMLGSQDAGYGAMGAGAVAGMRYSVGTGPGAGYGPNADQRNSYNNTGTAYPAYQNYPAQAQTMQQYSTGVPLPYNPASVGVGVGVGAGAGAATAIALGGTGRLYNNSNAPPPLANTPLPNPFPPNTMDAAGPVPINPPVTLAPPDKQEILVVRRTFTPTLPDELSIANGEAVRVLAVYDDGWCKARKLDANGDEGVVPYECLEYPAAQRGSTPV